MRGIFIFGCMFYFVVGVIHISIGSLTPYLLDYFNIAANDLSVIIFFQFFGFVNGVILSPMIVKRYNHLQVITFGLIVLILVLSGFFIIKDWYYIGIMMFLLGYGAGTLETTIGSLIIATHKDNVEKMSKLEVFFGLGAFTFPILVHIFIDIENWFLPFYVLFALLLVMLVGWSILLSKNQFEINDLKHQFHIAPDNNKVIQHFIHHPIKFKFLFLIACFAFLYAGIETNLANFLPVIMINLGFENYSLISVSVFWSGIVLGRLVIGNLSKKITYSNYLIVSCLLLIVFLNLFPYIAYPLLQLVNIFLIAFSIAGIFPIVLTLSSIIIGKYVDEVTSIFIAAASFGGAIISLLIGWSIENGHTLLIFTIMAAILIWLSTKIKYEDTVKVNSTQKLS
nr:MFS transporter [Virgibacillus sp. AGTR]